jgi:hypothetical protein
MKAEKRKDGRDKDKSGNRMRVSCQEHRDSARGELACFDNSQNVKMISAGVVR